MTRRFSVVIPTYQRRDLVVLAVSALARQTDAPPFEVIVVVDGSTDGSAEALRGLRTPFPLAVIEQPNRGAAAARNAGAAAARGEILLFLDDDMEADPRLLSVLDEAHTGDADVVLGHLPLHPDSPDNVVSRAVGDWALQRMARLSRPDAALTVHDLLTGQLSLSSELFGAIGGFDESFTRDGLFGGEDLDFGLRLLLAGRRLVFEPAAVSRQRYVVDPGRHLEQCREAGRSDVELLRKHPDRIDELAALSGAQGRMSRLVWRRLVALPLAGAAITAVLTRLAARLARRDARTAQAAFSRARMVAYLRGAHESGGLPGRPARVVVLAYHDVDASPSSRYTVSPLALRRQLLALRRWGYAFIRLDELEAALTAERPLPARSVLITFDDCYVSLLETVAPTLRELGVPAAAFAVTGKLGATNDWDAHLGVPPRRLLDARQLLELSQYGIALGAHSRSHPVLPSIPRQAVEEEVRGSLSDLVELGLGPVRAFAYPYGEHSPDVVRIVAGAVPIAFAIDPGVVVHGCDPHRIPRIEMLCSDGVWLLRIKMLWARVPPHWRATARAPGRHGRRLSAALRRARAATHAARHHRAGERERPGRTS